MQDETLSASQSGASVMPGAIATQRTGTNGKRGRQGFLSPLRLANFRWLVAGQSVSRIGDQFYFVALPWMVLRATSAPFALALVMGSSAVAIALFTLSGGVLADRLGPRNVMLAADVWRMACMIVFAVLALSLVLPVWALVLFSVMLGAAGGLFYPASNSIIPHIVQREDLQAANSFEQLTFQTGNFLGPGLAGALFSVASLGVGLIVDALSFLISVGSLFFIKLPRNFGRSASNQTNGESETGVSGGGLGEAFRYLWHTPFLLTLLCLSVVGNFSLQGIFEVALPLLLKSKVGVVHGPQAMGVVMAFFGVGSIAGAVLVGQLTRLAHRPLVAVVVLIPAVVAIAAMPLTGSIPVLGGMWAAVGCFLAVSNVLFATVMQQFAPLEMMGRLSSVTMMGSFIGSPLSIFVYGIAASVVPSLAWLFVGGALLTMITLAVALTQRVIWATR